MSDTSDENKALTIKFFEEVFNNANLSAIDDLLSPNYLYNGQPSSVADNKAWVTSLHKQFPGLRFVIEAILAEDAMVALRWRMDAPASGQRPAGYQTGTNILTFVAGQALTNDQDGKTSDSWTTPSPA